MASSTVEIANLALSRIGQKPITSLDDPTATAQLCKANIGPARKAMIVAFGEACRFAHARASLPALGTGPAWGFEYAYQLPSDHLHTLEVDVDEEETPWQVEGSTIVTDATAPLGILYLRDEEDPAKFDAAFTDALADQLAGEIVFGITKDMKYRGPFFATANNKAETAKTRLSQQGTATLPDSDALIRVR